MHTTRREWLYGLGATLGTAAFNAMLRAGEEPASGAEASDANRFASAMASGKRYYVKSPFAFRRAGRSGIPSRSWTSSTCASLWMNTLFEELAGVADDLCVYRGTTNPGRSRFSVPRP